MATHCSVPAWRIPWTEKLGGYWWAVVRGVAESDTTEQEHGQTWSARERGYGWSCVLPEAVPR